MSKRRGSGGRNALGVILIVLAVLASLYIFAPNLTDAFPAYTDWVNAYVFWVDDIRKWLQNILRSVLDYRQSFG